MKTTARPVLLLQGAEASCSEQYTALYTVRMLQRS